jgi:hypothetical protein
VSRAARLWTCSRIDVSGQGTKFFQSYIIRVDMACARDQITLVEDTCKKAALLANGCFENRIAVNKSL